MLTGSHVWQLWFDPKLAPFLLTSTKQMPSTGQLLIWIFFLSFEVSVQLNSGCHFRENQLQILPVKTTHLSISHRHKLIWSQIAMTVFTAALSMKKNKITNVQCESRTPEVWTRWKISRIWLSWLNGVVRMYMANLPRHGAGQHHIDQIRCRFSQSHVWKCTWKLWRVCFHFIIEDGTMKAGPNYIFTLGFSFSPDGHVCSKDLVMFSDLYLPANKTTNAVKHGATPWHYRKTR